MPLKNKIAVVAGGTGGVGGGIVKVLLEAGAKVVVPSRTKEKAENLRQFLNNFPEEQLDILVTDLGHPEQAQKFKDQVLEKYPEIELVVASLGSWYRGKTLNTMPYQDWNKVLQNNLNTHFYMASSFLPQLKKQGHGMYIMINGGAMDSAIPNSGAISVVAAAQKMMSEVLATEAKKEGIKVYSIAAFAPVSPQGEQDQDGWLSAEEVGHYILDLYEGKSPASLKVVHKLYPSRSFLNK